MAETGEQHIFEEAPSDVLFYSLQEFKSFRCEATTYVSWYLTLPIPIPPTQPQFSNPTQVWRKMENSAVEIRGYGISAHSASANVGEPSVKIRRAVKDGPDPWLAQIKDIRQYGKMVVSLGYDSMDRSQCHYPEQWVQVHWFYSPGQLPPSKSLYVR